MKAVVVEAPNQLAVRDVPEPSVGPYQALAQTLSCGLCGTDKRIVKGQFYRRSFPGILGHESVGRVVTCGEMVRNFVPGDLVLRTTAVYPDEQLGGMSSLLGGLAEYGLVTDWVALQDDQPGHKISPWWLGQQKLPAAFDAINGGMFITLKELLSWTEQVGVSTNESVAVVGLGPVGLMLVRICKLLGASPVVAVGRRQRRMELARRLGADLVVDASSFEAREHASPLPDRYDLILDTAGDREVLALLPSSLRDRGRLAIYSIPDEQRIALDWSWGGDVPRNWSLVFRTPREHDQHQRALDCLDLGFVDFGPFLTHKYKLEDIHGAWTALESGRGVKVTIEVGP
jgi:threonine dehydrogenase-like Zn-dependent dehydrogenase